MFGLISKLWHNCEVHHFPIFSVHAVNVLWPRGFMFGALTQVGALGNSGLPYACTPKCANYDCISSVYNAGCFPSAVAEVSSRTAE